MKKRWHFWLGLVASAAALFMALRGIDVRGVFDSIAKAQYLYVVPAVVSTLLYLLARAVRWRLLLGGRVSLARSFWVTCIGYLASDVLPFRLGDPARAVAIGAGGDVRVSTGLSTIVIERVLDMLMVVLLLAISLPFVGEAGWLRGVGIAAGIGALMALVLLVAVARQSRCVVLLSNWVEQRMGVHLGGRWEGTLDGLMEGLGALREARAGLQALGWSAVAWALVVSYYYFMSRAFVSRVSVIQGVFLTCAVGLGMAVPSAPGAVGVFHSFARYALEIPFSIPTESAVAIAFASHGVQYVLVAALGMLGLLRENLSLSRLREDASTAVREVSS